eukprot:2964539-Rhodomonas_salina.1
MDLSLPPFLPPPLSLLGPSGGERREEEGEREREREGEGEGECFERRFGLYTARAGTRLKVGTAEFYGAVPQSCMALYCSVIGRCTACCTAHTL